MASQLSKNIFAPNKRLRTWEGFNGIFIHQKKYVIDMPQETRLMDAKPTETPLETFIQLEPNGGELWQDDSRYRGIVGKIIYHTITAPNFSFIISAL